MTKVLKPFPWSPNGYTVERLNIGDDRNFGASTKSLADEGLIEADAPQETTKKTKK